MAYWDVHSVIFPQTDGKGVYKTSLSGEYIHAARTFSFSKQDLWQLTLGSIDHIFAPDTIKTLLHNKWQLACPWWLL